MRRGFLQRRLALSKIGLYRLSATLHAASLSNLRGGSDAMWTNIEIEQPTFDGFGDFGDPPLVAA